MSLMYKYPVEVISDTYVSKIGGFSYEIEKKEIGINAKALEVNTSIIPNETYAVLRFLDEKIRPYFLRRRFLVVGVYDNMECYDMTKNGEVILSEELRSDLGDREGDKVIINTAEFFRIDGDYSKIAKAMLWRLGSRERRN